MDLAINSWRCCKQAGQSIRFAGDHLKLICASGMAMMKILKEEKKYVTVEIKWDRECLREGDSETSRDKLMRSKWNSSEHKQGTWRENLHHMAKTAEDL